MCSDVSKCLRHIPTFFCLPIGFYPVYIKELETCNCNTVTYFQNFRNGNLKGNNEFSDGIFQYCR